jgi:hypothetical protein
MGHIFAQESADLIDLAQRILGRVVGERIPTSTLYRSLSEGTIPGTN